MDPTGNFQVFGRSCVDSCAGPYCGKDLLDPNVEFCGSVSYAEVAEKTRESDILVIVEGFRRENVSATRYSLSTKVADSLASGAQILVYGSEECGVVESVRIKRNWYVAFAGCWKIWSNKNGIMKMP